MALLIYIQKFDASCKNTPSDMDLIFEYNVLKEITEILSVNDRMYLEQIISHSVNGLMLVRLILYSKSVLNKRKNIGNRPRRFIS